MDLNREQIRNGDFAMSVLRRDGSPTFVFLHGLAGFAAEWGSVVAALDPSFGLWLPDLRGHASSRVAGDVTLDLLISDVVALIDQSATTRGLDRSIPIESNNAKTLQPRKPVAANKELLDFCY